MTSKDFVTPGSDRCYSLLPTPIGTVLLIGDGSALTGLSLGTDRRPIEVPAGLVRDDASLGTAREELGRYLSGEGRAFTCPLAPRGTPFQLAVWRAVLAIPYGETRSYTDIAQAVGRPGAVRAVGAANAANPISLIIPCHRVIGRDGDLRGYGWGLPRKRWLLAMESGVRCPAAERQAWEA